MTAVLLSYLPLLLLTIVVECTLIAASAPRGRQKEMLIVCIALNLLTHPLATLWSWRWSADVFSLELMVFLFEWLGYSQLLRISIVRALRVAFLPNLCSALVGIGIWIARMSQ